MKLHAVDIPWGEGAKLVDPPLRFSVLDDVSILHRPATPQRWAGRLQADGLTFTIGPPETWKTFIALGLEMAALAGAPWLGADVQPIDRAIYVVGEGITGVKQRIVAWKAAHQIPADHRLGLLLVDGAVNLFRPGEVDAFIDQVVVPHAPVNVSFDTLARCSLGADENSAKDMGSVVDSAQRVQRACKASVNILHHTNASENRERGSSALRGAADNMLLLLKTDDVVTLSSTKNKDMDAFDPVKLRLVPVPGTESCIVRLAQDVLHTGVLSPSQRQALNALWSTFGTEGATSTEWMEALPGVARRTFYAARKALTDAGYVLARGPRLIPQRRPQ